MTLPARTYSSSSCLSSATRRILASMEHGHSEHRRSVPDRPHPAVAQVVRAFVDASHQVEVGGPLVEVGRVTVDDAAAAEFPDGVVGGEAAVVDHHGGGRLGVALADRLVLGVERTPLL